MNIWRVKKKVQNIFKREYILSENPTENAEKHNNVT
jgi:hypothetical protein